MILKYIYKIKKSLHLYNVMNFLPLCQVKHYNFKIYIIRIFNISATNILLHTDMSLTKDEKIDFQKYIGSWILQKYRNIPKKNIDEYFNKIKISMTEN